MSSWPRLHPDWEVWLWTDDDLEALVMESYPKLLHWYSAAPLDVLRFDLARYLVLHAYGGIYADADYEAYRPFGPVLQGAELVLGWEWTGSPGYLGPSESAWRSELSNAVDGGFTVGNAVMASTRHHPLWGHLVQWLVGHRPSTALRSRDVWDLSGPAALTRTLARWSGPARGTRILTAEQLYPISWHMPMTDDGYRSSDFSSAYGAHHWAGTWWQPQPVVDTWAPAQLADHKCAPVNQRRRPWLHL